MKNITSTLQNFLTKLNFKIKTIFTLILTVSLLFSCSKENNVADDRNNENLTEEYTETNIELITGLTLRSFDRDPIVLGNPNVFTGNKFTAWSNKLGENFVSISRSIIINNEGKITDIWIVPGIAEKKFQQIDFNSILDSTLYTQTEIEEKATIKLNGLNLGGAYIIGSELLTPGKYYKVFVKIDGKIYWDNLYFFPGTPTSEEYQNFINWWKS